MHPGLISLDATERDLDRRRSLPDGHYLIGETIVREDIDDEKTREAIINAAEQLETNNMLVSNRPLAGIEMHALLARRALSDVFLNWCLEFLDWIYEGDIPDVEQHSIGS